MRIAFLNPLEERLKDFPAKYLAGHEVLTTTDKTQPPAGYETAEAIVWSDYPVDAALIDRMPNLRFMQRIGLLRAKGDARRAVAERRRSEFDEVCELQREEHAVAPRFEFKGRRKTVDAIRPAEGLRRNDQCRCAEPGGSRRTRSVVRELVE